MLEITMNKGYRMTFANGWTVSVQFGYGNYCKNFNHPQGYKFANGSELVQSPNAEIAAWDKNGQWYNFETDTVKGWCRADEVAEFISKISKL